MRRFILSILFISLLPTAPIVAQSCLPEGIEFTTQGQIDSFAINYPACTEIEGDVRITGNGIVNLIGLSTINSIEGRLTIQNNPLLYNLLGLHVLTQVGSDVLIAANENLTSISDFLSLTSVDGDLDVVSNNKLLNIEGLNNLSHLGDNLLIQFNNELKGVSGLNNLLTRQTIDISHNQSLEKITGLDKVSSLWDFRIINNSNLQNISGFNSLDSVRSMLFISVNDSLSQLNGIANLRHVGAYFVISWNYSLTALPVFTYLSFINGDLAIMNNESLSSLSGLITLDSLNGSIIIDENKSLESLFGIDNIKAESIMDLSITYNPQLSTCEIKSICDYLSSPSGTVEIYDNAPGCNSQAEVEAACGMIGISENTEEQAINIYPNPSDHYVNIRYSLLLTRYSLLIYDCFGRKMDEINIPAGQGESQIDVSQYANGIYIAIVKSDSGSFAKQKFVIAR